MPANNALQSINLDRHAACLRKRRAGYPSALLLRRRAFGRSLRLSAAFYRRKTKLDEMLSLKIRQNLKFAKYMVYILLIIGFGRSEPLDDKILENDFYRVNELKRNEIPKIIFKNNDTVVVRSARFEGDTLFATLADYSYTKYGKSEILKIVVIDFRDAFPDEKRRLSDAEKQIIGTGSVLVGFAVVSAIAAAVVFYYLFSTIIGS